MIRWWLQRRRPRRKPFDLRLQKQLTRPQAWMVDLRIENVGEATGRDIVALGATHANWNPPRATMGDGRPAPEIEVTLEIWATTGDIAEREGRRRADRLHMNVLASRHWRWPDGESPMWKATARELAAARDLRRSMGGDR